MKYYWRHHKLNECEAWSLTISWSTKCAWLYHIDENKWRFRLQDDANCVVVFENISKREAMKRCVAIMKAFYEMENGNKERKEQC